MLIGVRGSRPLPPFPPKFRESSGKAMSLSDRLFDLLLQWLDAPIISQAAGEVARECRAPSGSTFTGGSAA